jgi:hypothetical protein
MIKSYRLEKLGQIAKFKIWQVDGAYIRKNLDGQFTNFGQHYRFKYIPKNELWLDKENARGEKDFYLDHLLLENRLMAKGLSYSKAIEAADRLEKSERRKSKAYLKAHLKKESDQVKKIHQKLIKKYSHDDLKVWLVSGELVRDLYDVDFTEGGHDLVYHFVPHGEIWLDDDLSPKERKFVLLHEAHERNLMVEGWSYDGDPRAKINKSAHRSASIIEYHCRHHVTQIEKKLLAEIKKSLKIAK